jgi:chromosome segregation ATPase
MMWVIFGVVIAIMWSKMSQGDWSGKGSRRRAGMLKQYDDRIAALESELASRDDAIVQLESRVNELESRLDFTERLLTAKDAGLRT